MEISEVVGSVAGLWRFPVKSMRGEQLQEMVVTERGVLGDRAYALIDQDTGKVVSAKSVKLFPDLFGCKAAFVEPPRQNGNVPAVQITLPDGTSVRSDSAEVDRVLSAYFKRNVRLGQVAPDDFTIDQYHPDVEGADPGGNRDKVVDLPLGSALSAAIGMESPVPVGSFLDFFPMSVLTTSTLARLNELQPQSRFDERRFRMNVIVDTKRPGFIENDWLGHELALGDGARLNVTLPDPRCVMTTLAQGDLPKDTDVLRALVRHNKQRSMARRSSRTRRRWRPTCIVEFGPQRPGERSAEHFVTACGELGRDSSVTCRRLLSLRATLPLTDPSCASVSLTSTGLTSPI